jgi:transposase
MSHGRPRKPYPSDVSDEEWSLAVGYVTLMKEEAPQREYPLRELFNALRYVVRCGQISRELDRLELLLTQLKAIETERDALHCEDQGLAAAPAKLLLGMKGIGPEFAAMLCHEGLFRHFDNRRQLAAYAGLAHTPWQSGQIDREQGVSKAGNPGSEQQ